jgi:hypothetical protein
MTIPTSHDRSFVPYGMGTDPKFEKCLPDTLKQEGGYSKIRSEAPAMGVADSVGEENLSG